jgi:DNA-binding transcriptional ArsR family regulator
MTATVRRLRTKVAHKADAAVAQLRLALEEIPNLPDEIAGRVSVLLERHTRTQRGWSFVMINPALYHDVVMSLTKTSKRPLLALKLWSLLFSKLPPDSNEVQATREDLARDLDCRPAAVSEIMGELERLGAVYRQREGRGVRYSVNPILGTHLAGSARDKAQAVAPELRLVEPA